jgi:amidase
MSASRSETIRLDTQDCYQGLITEDPATHLQIQQAKQIPVTGPVYVEGADIGDVLCVHIQNINLSTTGVFAIRPQTGIIGQDIRDQVVRVLPIKSNGLMLNKSISVPLQPVVGVIGVAPRHGEIETVYPGRHGGNMDTLEITTGARVYLPVQVKGALLSIGDVKAGMGDGQIAGSGVETAAEITVRVDTLPGGKFSWPRVETKDAWVTITSASSVDQASRLAVSEMIRWLGQEKGLDFETAYMLVSISGALHISQWDNPLITARIVFPKSIVRDIRSKSASSGRPIFLTTLPDISDEREDSHSEQKGTDTSSVESATASQTNERKEETPPQSSSRSLPRQRRRRPSASRRNTGQKKLSETSKEKPETGKDALLEKKPASVSSQVEASDKKPTKVTAENKPASVSSQAEASDKKPTKVTAEKKPASVSSQAEASDKKPTKVTAEKKPASVSSQVEASDKKPTKVTAEKDKEPGEKSKDTASKPEFKKRAPKRRSTPRRTSTQQSSAGSSSNQQSNRPSAGKADDKKDGTANQTQSGESETAEEKKGG